MRIHTTSSTSDETIDEKLIRLDRFFEKAPILSSLSAIWNLFQKYVLHQFSFQPKNRYYTYISEKSTIRSLFLLIPIIGNIIVVIIDRAKEKRSKEKENKEHEIKESIPIFSFLTKSADDKQFSNSKNSLTPQFPLTNLGTKSLSKNAYLDEEFLDLSGQIDKEETVGYQHIKNMKNQERRALFNAFETEANLELYDSFTQSLQSPNSISYTHFFPNTDHNAHAYQLLIDSIAEKTALSRQIREYGTEHGSMLDPTQLVEKIKLSQIDESFSSSYTTTIKNEISQIPILDLYRELCKKLQKIHMILQKDTLNEKRGLQERNREIQLLLRECEIDPAYQLCKYDESIPAIKYIHALALTATIGIDQSLIFQKLMEKYQNTSGEKEVSVRDLFLKRSLQIVQNGIYAHDSTPTYWFNFPKQTFGAIKSHIPMERIGYSYDPRVDLENISGTIYFQDIHLGEEHKPHTIQFICTPTPTVADKIAPEISLMLQAIENRRILKLLKTPIDLSYSDVIYWHYTNLQNLADDQEGSRSYSIMKLAKKYPLSFSAISISHDSSFYKDGIHAKEPEQILKEICKHQTEHVPTSVIEKWTTRAHTPTYLNEKYKETLKQLLLDPNNYSLENISKGTGYFFPINKGTEEYSLWETKTLDAILDIAYTKASKLKMPEDYLSIERLSDSEREKIFQWEQKAVFRELVSLGITRYFQTLSALSITPETGTIIQNSSCKEDIDRGGKFSAALKYANTKEREEAENGMMEVGLSRALLSRYRTIISHRLWPLIVLITHISHPDLQKFLNEEIPELITPKCRYTPHLN